jgi:hypothetical protein
MPGKGVDGSTFGLVRELKSKACPKLGGKLMVQSYLLNNYVHTRVATHRQDFGTVIISGFF